MSTCKWFKMTINSLLAITILSLNLLRVDAVSIASFPIGGLFNSQTASSSHVAFGNIAAIGGRKSYHGRALVSDADDSYSTALNLCSFTSDSKGIVALIDARPTYGICDITCLLCNRLNITHLALGWQPTTSLLEDPFTLLYHPPPELVSKAYATLIKHLQWDKFTILYEEESSFIRLQEIIDTWPQDREPILFRKLDPDGDNKEMFKHIFKVAHMSYHVIDCDVKNVIKYMNEIVQVENSTQFMSFIMTNLDTYSMNLKDIPELLANVSTMHLTTANPDKWTDLGLNIGNLETALVVDALSHIEKTIKSMQEEQVGFSKMELDEPPDLCFRESKSKYEEEVWPSGANLIEALKKTKIDGFTGNVEFDEDGKRINFKLYYSKLNLDSEFFYVGDWESNTDVITELNTFSDRSQSRKSNKIRIATKVTRPYFEFAKTNDSSEVTYRGYAVDLIKAVFEIINRENNLNWEYEFYAVEKTGNPIPGSKKWDGLLGDIMEHKAELAISDLSITSDRNEVVDFSIPFMSLGISMLFREPEAIEPDMFSFLQPLALDVWLYLATTYIIVSFILLICARMSQDDWVNPHPCNQNPDNLQNIWSLYNCMWLTMGSIMTQGCDILPRAFGSRWVTGVWWFFAMIITASYTANMSTFLSNSRRSNDIADVKALADQKDIAYGAMYGGATYEFFRTSNDTVFHKIWTVMSSAKPTVFMDNNDEGKDRVLRSKGKYVFFMESTALEYFTARICELKMVGNNLDSKEYGIAMPKNYPFKSWIDHAILSLQESGKLTEFKKKWWEVEDNTAHCELQKENEEDDSGSLQMKNTSGIFLVLGFGGILGLLVAIVDFLLHAKEICVKEKVTFKEAVMSEWRASLDPRALHKLAAPPRSAPPSTASPSPQRERSQSRAVSVLRAASSFINFDEIY
ncbi:glutamate receptor ionotropic, kainate 2-like [Ostrinia furnacalis]|uniref:glutamate receptor ionotropic, kainate 2-like n=1 Tax=Ostrinia furnacalis TaxID=93504 RepID=UPI00103A68B6|nr:glutamate receptor ionotropic, kainate 2-like [Ostrinia furnacalis]